MSAPRSAVAVALLAWVAALIVATLFGSFPLTLGEIVSGDVC